MVWLIIINIRVCRVELAGKVVVVTGGGNGIGRQIVLILLGKGANVAAVDVNTQGLDETQTLFQSSAHVAAGATLTLHTCDISKRESVATLVDEVVAKHEHVDVIVNNAGVIHPFDNFSDMDYSIIERVINVNLYGVIHITKAFLPLLSQRPKARVVNISSMGGLFPFPKQTLYGATKAAIKLLSEGLHSELHNSNVGITVVFPGAIDTDIAKNCDANDANLQKFRSVKMGIAPEKAALRIVQVIEKERLHVYIGVDSKSLSFLYRMCPKLTIALLGKVMRMVFPD